MPSRVHWQAAVAAFITIVVWAAAAATASASIRLAFDYPWYPESATEGTQYHPNLLPAWPYDSGDPAVIDKQIASMRYGHIQGAISSWWGRGTPTDQRVPALLAASARVDPSFKRALYYEPEAQGDPTVAQIAGDLTYIKTSYAGDPAYLQVGGRPVIFVYADGSDGCAMADRWAQANAGIGFYVVLKVFAGYTTCASQPDAWHQYGPTVAYDRQGASSVSISPGFFKAGESAPRLPRDLARWAGNVRDMVAAQPLFQLVTTWNEWGEGTAVESATEWSSPTGNGYYDAYLRTNGQAFGTAVAACSDSLDNNFDGRTDYPADPTCSSPTDDSEGGAASPPPPPPPPPPPSGPCAASARPAAWHHVVLIVMENKDYSQIMGSSSSPYVNGLANQCALATNYHAVTHPSLPNYLAMTSGGTQGVTDDAAPSSHPLGAASIFSQLGAGWRALQESMPSNCALTSSGRYAVKHNPAAYFTKVRSACASQDVPLGSTPDIGAAYTFVTPNLCNDTHDCSIQTGDNWLKAFIPKLTGTAQYQAGDTAIFLTWDENDGSTSNHVPLIAVAPSVTPGTKSSASFTHYSLLRTNEEMLGLPLLGSAATAASMRSALGL